jgi:hypothetical protein
MPQIIVIHKDNKRAPLPKGRPIIFFSGKASVQEFMQKMIARGQDLIILTEIECDDAHAPCGCYGYDCPCDWHRGSSEDDFADCMCSRKYNITCSYHS